MVFWGLRVFAGLKRALDFVEARCIQPRRRVGERQQFHQSRLGELVNTSTPQYQDTLKRVTDYFAAQGASLAQAQQEAFTWIGQQLQTQAAYLAYIDVFWALMVISAAAVPLALILRKVKLGGPAPVGH